MIELSLSLISVAIILNALLLTSNIPFVSKTKKRNIIFDIAYSLVWDAERVWGPDAGHIKRAYVKAKLYITISALPMFRYIILKEEYIESIIDEALDKKKLYQASYPKLDK